MLHKLKGNFGGLVGIAAACVACVWLVAVPSAATGATNKMEVARVELACVVGQGSVKLRLTLASGQAVEYQAEDAREADVVLKMTELFVSGHARMFAELDGRSVVHAVQIAGPR